MTNTIQVQIREVYGNTTIYPVCERAKSFAAIAGTKTLTQASLREIRRIGFQVVVTDAFGIPAGRLAA